MQNSSVFSLLKKTKNRKVTIFFATNRDRAKISKDSNSKHRSQGIGDENQREQISSVLNGIQKITLNIIIIAVL